MAAVTVVVSDEAIRTLRTYLVHTNDAARQVDVYAFLEWDDRFHQGLLTPLCNRRLLDTVRRLRGESGLYRQTFVVGSDLPNASAGEHGQIMCAVERRDASMAGEMMARHLERTQRAYNQRRRLLQATGQDRVSILPDQEDH